LIVFDKFGRPRSGKGLGLMPKKTNIASTMKTVAENIKFGLDALKKTKADGLFKPTLTLPNSDTLFIIATDSQTAGPLIQNGKEVGDGVHVGDTIGFRLKKK
jgi:hypothetical protein